MENLKTSEKNPDRAAYKTVVSKKESACAEMVEFEVKVCPDLKEGVPELPQAINDYNNSLFGNLRQ